MKVIKTLTHILRILVHCNGDAAGDQFLRSYSKAVLARSDNTSYDLRPTMIHCQTVRDDQLDAMKLLGILPSVFVGHIFYWGDIHLKNLGAKRGSRISPCGSMTKRRMPLNFHQDTPVTKPDMLHSVWAAVTRTTRSGTVIDPEQRISAYEALKAVTVNPAYMYHEEKSKGTLEAGKRADLVILDNNPLTADPYKIRDIHVLETIKDGRVLYRK